MKNCFDCVHKVVKFSDLANVDGMTQVEGKLYVKCEVGNTDRMVHFYKENKDKFSGSIKEELSCFEETEFSKKTNELLNKMQDFLDEIKSS